MTPKQATTFLPMYGALLTLGLIRISKNDSWQDPATLAGIGTGLALVAVAWIIARHRARRSTSAAPSTGAAIES